MLGDQVFCSFIFKQNTLVIEVNLELFLKASKTHFKDMKIKITSSDRVFLPLVMCRSGRT